MGSVNSNMMNRDEDLQLAINAVYAAFLESEEAQKFTVDHPGQQMTLSLRVSVKSQSDRACELVFEDAGYTIQSAGAEAFVQKSVE